MKFNSLKFIWDGIVIVIFCWFLIMGGNVSGNNSTISYKSGQPKAMDKEIFPERKACKK